MHIAQLSKDSIAALVGMCRPWYMKYRSCDHSALKAYFHFSPRSLWKEFQHFAMISSLQQLHLRLISLWWTLYMVPWWLDLWTGLGVLPLPPSHNWSLTRIQPSLSFPLCKNNATKIKCVCIIRGLGPKPIRVRVPSSWKTWSPEQTSNLVPSCIFQKKSDCFAQTFLQYLWHVTCLNVKDSRTR